MKEIEIGKKYMYTWHTPVPCTVTGHRDRDGWIEIRFDSGETTYTMPNGWYLKPVPVMMEKRTC